MQTQFGLSPNSSVCPSWQSCQASVHSDFSPQPGSPQPWHTTLFGTLGFKTPRALAGRLTSTIPLSPQGMPFSSGPSAS